MKAEDRFFPKREDGSPKKGDDAIVIRKKGDFPMRKAGIWLLVALIIGGVVSHFASSLPDGFEKAGEETGFIHHATSFFASPFPDYAIPGLPGWVSTGLAGILGVLITFGVFLLLSRILVRKNR